MTCYSVLCELEVGIQQMSTLQENRRQLKRLQNMVKIWPLVEQTCRDYGSLALELKRMGRHLSMTDITLAALARRHKLIILTTDRDFEALPDLKTENWTV
ncbi:hypothetical protein BH11PLA2_BH11PLA2_14400 [soil metagenome]